MRARFDAFGLSYLLAMTALLFEENCFSINKKQTPVTSIVSDNHNGSYWRWKKINGKQLIMPRYLGKKYYEEAITAMKQVYSRAALTVPQLVQSVKNDNNHMDCDHFISLRTDLSSSELKVCDSLDDTDYDGSFNIVETESKLERLEWGTCLRVMEGSFVEIVPSSNPESSSSLCGSQQENLPQLGDVEMFTKVSLQQFTQDNAGEMEGLLTMRQYAPVTRLPVLLRSALDVLDPSFVGHMDHEPLLSETSLFRKSDLKLQFDNTSSGKSSDNNYLLPVSSLPLFSECYLPEAVNLVKAEEFLTPLNTEESNGISLDHGHADVEECVVSSAIDACCELDLSFVTLLDADHRTDDMETDIQDLAHNLVKEQAPDLIESLSVSASPSCPLPDLFDLIGCQNENERIAKMRVDSPLVQLRCSDSPLHFAEICTKDTVHLQPRLQPDKLQRQLLNTQEIKDLEKWMISSDASYSNLSKIKFKEPELGDTQQGSWSSCPVKDAQDLDHSHNHWEISLETNLGWNLAVNKCSLQSCTPEPLTFSDADMPPYYKHVIMDFETVESIFGEKKDDCSNLSEKKPDDFAQKCEERNLEHLSDLSLSVTSGKRGGIVDYSSVKSSELVDLRRSSHGNAPDLTSGELNFAFTELTKENDPFNESARLRMKRRDNSLEDEEQFSGNKAAGTDGHSEAMMNEEYIWVSDESNTEIVTSWSPGSFSEHRASQQSLLPDSLHLDTADSTSQPPHDDTADSTSKPPHDDTANGTSKPLHARPSSDCLDHTDLLSSRFKTSGSKNNTKDGLLQDGYFGTLPSNESCNVTFDLQFDKDDFLASSGSVEMIPTPETGAKRSETRSVEKQHCFVSPLSDPVDTFLMLRDVNTSKGNSDRPGKGKQSIAEATPRQCRKHYGVVTPMSVNPLHTNEAKTCTVQTILTVGLPAPFVTILDDMATYCEPYLGTLKAEGLVNDVSLMGLKPDYTRFLLRDGINRLQAAATDGHDDRIHISLLMVHTLCSAASLLQQCCLESAIVHLAHMQHVHPQLKGHMERLRKAVFHHQFKLQESGCIHPKLAAVCREIQHHKATHLPPYRVLLVIRRDQPILSSTLQTVVGTDGTTIFHSQGNIISHWPEKMSVVLTWDQPTIERLLPEATLVIEFETVNDTSLLFTACKEKNINFVGLCTARVNENSKKSGNTINCPSVSTSSSSAHIEDGKVVIGSQKFVQNQRLIHILETRYSVIVLGRDYDSTGIQHYADVVVSAERGALLVHAKDLCEEGRLESLTEKFAALALQLTYIWVLLHCQADSSRVRLHSEVTKKVGQLQALLANLSTAAKGMTAFYKVLICQSAADMALYVHRLTDVGNLQPLCLSADMSNEEKFLLSVPCLNSYSCQLLLSRATLGKIMTMTADQLYSHYPELPQPVIQNLYLILNIDSGLHLETARTSLQTRSQPTGHMYNSQMMLTKDDFASSARDHSQRVLSAKNSCKGLLTRELGDVYVDDDKNNLADIHDSKKTVVTENSLGKGVNIDANLSEEGLFQMNSNNSIVDGPCTAKWVYVNSTFLPPMTVAKKLKCSDSEQTNRNVKYPTDSLLAIYPQNQIYPDNLLPNDQRDPNNRNIPDRPLVQPVSRTLVQPDQITPFLGPCLKNTKDSVPSQKCVDSGVQNKPPDHFVLKKSLPQRYILKENDIFFPPKNFQLSNRNSHSDNSLFSADYTKNISSQITGFKQQLVGIEEQSEMDICYPSTVNTAEQYTRNCPHDRYEEDLDKASANMSWLYDKADKCLYKNRLSKTIAEPLSHAKGDLLLNDHGQQAIEATRSLLCKGLPWKPHCSQVACQDPENNNYLGDILQDTVLPSDVGRAFRNNSVPLPAEQPSLTQSPFTLEFDTGPATDTGNFSGQTSFQTYNKNRKVQNAPHDQSLHGCSSLPEVNYFYNSNVSATSVLPENVPLVERSDSIDTPQARQQLHLLYGPRSSFSTDLATTTRRLLQGQHNAASLTHTSMFLHRPRADPTRVNIGLAQPLRRENPDLFKIGKGTRALDDSVRLQRGSDDSSSSPPLDMDNSPPPALQNRPCHWVSASKRQKLSTQLQGNTCTHPMTTENQSAARKLTYKAVSGSRGQTKLTFV